MAQVPTVVRQSLSKMKFNIKEIQATPDDAVNKFIDFIEENPKKNIDQNNTELKDSMKKLNNSYGRVYRKNNGTLTSRPPSNKSKTVKTPREEKKTNFTKEELAQLEDQKQKEERDKQLKIVKRQEDAARKKKEEEDAKEDALLKKQKKQGKYPKILKIWGKSKKIRPEKK